MTKVKVMRGIPGSGKSTIAMNLCAAIVDYPTIICSADDFFVSNGQYKFDVKKLDDAHRYCMRTFVKAINDGFSEYSLVVVDNTNINIEDISPYVAVGQAFNYDVEILQVNTPPEVAAKRNVHNVSEAKVQEMYKRLMDTKLPRRFKVTHL